MEIIKQRIQIAGGQITYKNYEKLDFLGKGGNAQCFEVERMEDHKSFAIKVIPKKLLTRPQKKSKILGQLQLHRTLKHPNICRMEEVFEDTENIYMLIELCSKGSFYDWIQLRKRFSRLEVQFYISQLLDALAYLHKHQIVHRDIKPGNLLLNEEMNLKIADFGMSTKIQFHGDKKHSICGTPNFIAPEVIQHVLNVPQSISGHSYQVDLWSVGVVIYTFLIGQAPFQTNDKMETYARVCRGKFSYPSWFKDAEAIDLINNLLKTNPKQRYTLKQTLKHPFLNPTTGLPKFIPKKGLIQEPYIKQFIPLKNKKGYQLREKMNETLTKLQVKKHEDHMNAFINRALGSNSPTASVIHQGKSNERTLLECGSFSSLQRSLIQQKNVSQRCNEQKLKMKSSHDPFQFSKKIQDDVESLKSWGFRSPRNSVNMESYRFSYENEEDSTQNETIPSYVVAYKKDSIWSYIMNSGYIGTYQTNANGYCVLYNSTDKIYLQIVNGEPARKTNERYAVTNDEITLRVKYLKHFESSHEHLKCQHYDPLLIENMPVVHVCKAYQVKGRDLILFKLSNDSLQLYNRETKMTLLMAEKDLYLIHFKENNETQIVHTQTSRVQDFGNKLLKTMYSMLRKIMEKVTDIQK